MENTIVIKLKAYQCIWKRALKAFRDSYPEELYEELLSYCWYDEFWK